MNEYLQIAQRLVNVPLLMEPGRASQFFSALKGQINYLQGVELATEDKPRVGDKQAGLLFSGDAGHRSFRYHEGVALLPVSGPCLHKWPYGMGRWSTGYDALIVRVDEAMRDQEVKGVLLDIDSPGGEVAGLFDTVRKLRELSVAHGKPIWALSYDLAASAAMGLASCASRRLVTQTGEYGSIGVIMAHSSREKMLSEYGVDITLIYAGEHKADGNPYESLPKNVYERFLSEVTGLRQEFAELISENISMSTDDILATEALMYRGQNAVDIGLADEVVNGNDAIDIFSNFLSASDNTITIGMNMSTENSAVAPETEASVDAKNKGPDAAPADESDKSARQAERDRISAITTADESVGREGLAKHLAYNTDMSAESAIETLKAATLEKPATAASDTGASLDKLMSGENQVDIAADTSSSNNDDKSVSATLMGDYNAATGRK